MLTPSHIKAYMLMTLQGLEYLHDHWILHRVSLDASKMNASKELLTCRLLGPTYDGIKKRAIIPSFKEIPESSLEPVNTLLQKIEQTMVYHFSI